MSPWTSGRVSVSYTGDRGFKNSNLFEIILFLSLNSANSVKTLRENSIKGESMKQKRVSRVYFVLLGELQS